MIVGSVGPYGASLHDGSEYTGSYANTTSPETMRNWHRPRINALVEAGVDILALETIPCVAEAEMLVELIKEYPNIKAWLSFSCSVSITTPKANATFIVENVLYSWTENQRRTAKIFKNLCDVAMI